MKQEKRFSFTIHLMCAPIEISQFGDTPFVVTIGGIGTYYPEDEFDQITYDIDEVTHEDINVLPFLKVLYKEVNDIEDFRNAVMNHLNCIFHSEYKSHSIFKSEAS